MIAECAALEDGHYLIPAVVKVTEADTAGDVITACRSHLLKAERIGLNKRFHVIHDDTEAGLRLLPVAGARPKAALSFRALDNLCDNAIGESVKRLSVLSIESLRVKPRRLRAERVVSCAFSTLHRVA